MTGVQTCALPIFDRVKGRWNVVGGELALQRQCRRRYYNPLAGIPDQPEQRRSQIAERFARSRAGLDQEMMIRFQTVRNGVGHLDLTGSLGTADRLNRCREDIAVCRGKTDSLGPSGHRRTLITSAPASQHPSVQPHRVTHHQLVGASVYGASSAASDGLTRAATNVPLARCSVVRNSPVW